MRLNKDTCHEKKHGFGHIPYGHDNRGSSETLQSMEVAAAYVGQDSDTEDKIAAVVGNPLSTDLQRNSWAKIDGEPLFKRTRFESDWWGLLWMKHTQR